MRRRRSPGESRHREIEAAPEEVHGARLAEERSLEVLERAVGREQHTMKAPDVIRIIGRMHVVFRERNRIGNFVRTAVDSDVQTQIAESLEQTGVKRRDRFSSQRQCARRPVIRADDERMLHEIEVDLKRAGPVRDRRSGEAAGGDVQSRVPRVIAMASVRGGSCRRSASRDGASSRRLPVAIVERGPRAGARLRRLRRRVPSVVLLLGAAAAENHCAPFSVTAARLHTSARRSRLPDESRPLSLAQLFRGRDARNVALLEMDQDFTSVAAAAGLRNDNA